MLTALQQLGVPEQFHVGPAHQRVRPLALRTGPGGQPHRFGSVNAHLCGQHPRRLLHHRATSPVKVLRLPKHGSGHSDFKKTVGFSKLAGIS